MWCFVKQRKFFFTMIIKLVLALAIMPMVSCTRGCKNNDIDKTITIDIATPFEALDPRYATSAIATRISALIYARLFELGNDGQPRPFLAASFSMPNDKTAIVTLRDGIKFHDGSPISADDVVYTFATLGTPDVASPHAEKFDYVQNIRAASPKEIVFELKKPHAAFLTDLSAIGIVAKHVCLDKSKICRDQHIGSGPYVVKLLDHAKESIHLEPFADWHEGASQNNLLFRVVRDENTRMLELIGRKADLVDGEFEASNAEELKKQKHLSVKEIPGFGYSYIAFNLRGPKSDDDKTSDLYRTRAALAHKQVRQAIAQAIDFAQIIDKLLLGTAERVSGLIPNGHWAKDASLKPPTYDPKRAEELLDQAGFLRHGANNMRFKLTISTTPNRSRQNAAQLYADFLKRVGIDASIRVKDWSAIYQDMQQGQFEMFSAIWVPVTEPDLYYFVHHSKSIPDENHAGGNRHAYVNTEVDTLIEQARTLISQDDRKLLYHKIERILLEDLPYIPLWNEHRIIVINEEKLAGYKPSPTGSLLGLRHIKVMKTATVEAGS